jgi:hypothetical protein
MRTRPARPDARDPQGTSSTAALHVLTVPSTLPHRVLDQVLTAVESALLEAGATHVWVSAERPDLAVMADLPGEAVPPRARG